MKTLNFSTALAARRHRQRGQSSIEYAVVCAALALVLGVGMIDDTSVLHELIEALKLAYRKISFAVSIPT